MEEIVDRSDRIDPSDDDVDSGDNDGRVKWTHEMIDAALDIVTNNRHVAGALDSPTQAGKMNGWMQTTALFFERCHVRVAPAKV